MTSLLRVAIFLLYCQLGTTKWRRTFNIKNCPSPPQIPFAFPMQEIWSNEKVETEGASLTYKCDEGYTQLGANNLYCLKKKHQFAWSKPAFICDPVHCIPPDHPKNGRFIGNNFTYGEIISIQCDKGYRLFSSDGKIPLARSVLVCSSNGTWTGTIPQCLAVLCPLPEKIPNGIAKATTRDIGGKIVVLCNPGFKSSRVSDVTCSKSGKWDGVIPDCLPVERRLKLMNEVNDDTLGNKFWRQMKDFFTFNWGPK